MSSLNQVTLIGNIGRDPVLNYTGSGTAVANLSVATQYGWKNKEGDRQETTDWHRVVVWKQQAERCCQYLKKGSKVGLTGRLTTREWERDGVTHYTTEIIASDVIFLDKSQSSSSRENGSYPAEPSGPAAAPRPQSNKAKPSGATRQRSNQTEQDLSNLDTPDDLPF